MQQYTANVLAKWQVVIPKELRDEMGINVWDTLTCFARWSAIVLKKKIQTIAYGSDTDKAQLPMGVENGKTLTVAIEEMRGTTCLIGKQWFGRAVHALNMMINMYLAWKSIIVLDPYGDLISEIKNYIADLCDTSVYHYIVWESTDWISLKNKIIKDKKQKIVAISTNFQWIGAKKSAELSKPIIMDCCKELMNNETALFIDEFSTYFDEKILSTVVATPGYKFIIDQSWDALSRDQVKKLFSKINHIAIYQATWITAKYLVDDLGLSHTVQDLRSIEKHHFYFYSFNGNKSAGKLLLGLYPIS